jgi:hypothetical protein
LCPIIPTSDLKQTTKTTPMYCFYTKNIRCTCKSPVNCSLCGVQLPFLCCVICSRPQSFRSLFLPFHSSSINPVSVRGLLRAMYDVGELCMVKPRFSVYRSQTLDGYTELLFVRNTFNDTVFIWLCILLLCCLFATLVTIHSSFFFIDTSVNAVAHRRHKSKSQSQICAMQQDSEMYNNMRCIYSLRVWGDEWRYLWTTNQERLERK